MTAASGDNRGLRIGIFIPLLPPEYHGGAELQGDRMARELACRGHDVHVFARAQAGHPRHEERDGVHVHRRPVVPAPGARLVAEVLLGGLQAARLRPDVLLCYMTMNSGLLGAWASALCGAPFVIWQRIEAESLDHAPAWERRAAFALHRRAAAQWLQAESFVTSMRRQYDQAGRSAAWTALAPRIRVLGNGVDLPPPVPLAAVPARRFLFVGRLVEQKGLPTLIDAAHQLPEAEFVIAGDGPLRAELEQRARGAAVRFLGEVPHPRIAELLRDARALVLCSSWEGVPNVVLEALAHSRPVVATPVGAIPDLVQDGVNGYRVPVGNVPALAAALRATLDDTTWHRLAGAARPSVERFGWPQLVGAVERELHAVAGRPVPVVEESAHAG